jgi:hypothetical protein
MCHATTIVSRKPLPGCAQSSELAVAVNPEAWATAAGAATLRIRIGEIGDLLGAGGMNETNQAAEFKRRRLPGMNMYDSTHVLRLDGEEEKWRSSEETKLERMLCSRMVILELHGHDQEVSLQASFRAHAFQMRRKHGN